MIEFARFSGFIYVLSLRISTILTAILAKRKTTTPMITAFYGFIISFIPPLGFIFIGVLLIKDDVTKHYSSTGYINRL